MNQNASEFAFFKINEAIPFFDENGNILYNDIDQKLIKCKRVSEGNVIDSMISEYILDEKLYIRLLPSNKLYLVTHAKTERHRIVKI